MSAKQPVRVAILGSGRRSTNLYRTLAKALPDEVQLVGVWGRSPESSQRLGFDARPLQVTSAVHQFELTPHRARWGGRPIQLPLDPDIYLE